MARAASRRAATTSGRRCSTAWRAAGARSRSICTRKASTRTMIDRALATGMPVNVSPKYWAEHLGMPYHQAAIRELEMPVDGPHRPRTDGAQRRLAQLHALRLRRSAARRSPLHRAASRLVRDAAPAPVRRIPLGVAAYSRMFQFCGSTGMDLDGAAHVPRPARKRAFRARAGAVTWTIASSPGGIGRSSRSGIARGGG